MITLYAFGPAFGLPDPSLFVTKVEVLLKMAGLPYRTDTTGLQRAPNGKLPYIDVRIDLVAEIGSDRVDGEQDHIAKLLDGSCKQWQILAEAECELGA
jgi:hypothetical protein